MNQERGLIDKRTWIAVIVVIIVWIGWQSYLSKKYPTAERAISPTTTITESQPAAQAPAGVSSRATTLKQAAPLAENTLLFDDQILSFQVSSKGMGLRNFILKNYKDRQGKQVVITSDVPDASFETKLLGVTDSIQFTLSRTDTGFRGVAQYGNMNIEKTLSVDSNRYVIDVTTSVSGMQPGVTGVYTKISDIIPEGNSSFLMPSMEYHSLYVRHGTTYIREHLNHDGEGAVTDERAINVSLISLGSLYFTQAAVDQSEIHPEFEARYLKLNGATAVEGELKYLFPAGLSQTTLKQKLFIGPKELSLLSSVDPQLEGVVDFWILGSIARPMLNLMKWFYSLFGNWGVAIILLTLAVRTLVLPLYLSSFKSMKAMQKIQPRMQAIREKHKGDPQQMNMEVMRLFKENKVNPFGGCFPMLLQFPIFIALYRVFSQSIELYRAPFILWINDLSLKDPYFVLPVLMGVAMFVQQKITPTSTADPAQQKMLQFMPVIFSLMMLTLPSGLTLYIFVSTLYGIIQQKIFMKDKTAKPVSRGG